jgi:hypothetical protein
MKYAFFPGCVSKGACPELYQSVMQVYPKLGIELVEMTTASCTGAGVLQEKDLRLGDALNARPSAPPPRAPGWLDGNSKLKIQNPKTLHPFTLHLFTPSPSTRTCKLAP